MTYYERNLPHWQPANKIVFVTWRLFGSLPRRALARIKSGPGDAGHKFLAADRLLDSARSGPLWLATPAIAHCVETALLRGVELGQYVAHAWVVMPNHVHVLIDPRVPLPRITMGIKRASAKDANSHLGRTGKPFWQDESFDRRVRDSSEFERTRLH